jgi:uncharacterized protein YndB with AHSA1/START domain
VAREKSDDGSFTARFNTVIHADCESIFNALLGVDQYSGWFKAARVQMKDKQTRPQVHSHFDLSIGWWPVNARFSIRIVEVQAPEILTFRIFQGDFIGQMEWTIRPQSEGAWVSLDWQRFYASSAKAKFLMGFTYMEWQAWLIEMWFKALKKKLETPQAR